jgi:hypothetical protein
MKNTILTLLFIAFLTSCSKDSATETPADTLPPATTTGANTAGCNINGKLLIPKNGSQAIGGPPSYGLTTGAGGNFHPPTIGGDYFYVKVVNYKDNPSCSVWVQVNDLSNGTGTYNLGIANGNLFSSSPNNPFMIVKICDGVNPCKIYYSVANSGNIVITRFDYPNGIYSGTFNGSLFNKDNTTEIIQVTDGRFDIRIATLNH